MATAEQGQTQNSQLLHCLSLLSAETRDEDKFAALLILPRLLDHNNEETLRYAFTGMNWRFIGRLLAAKPNDGLPADTLHAIAVHIIASFCTDAELCAKQEMHGMVPGMINLLVTKEDEVAESVLRCLSGIVLTDVGARIIDASHGLEALTAVIKSDHKESNRSLGLNILRQYAHWLTSSNDDNAHAQAISQMMPSLAHVFANEQGQLKFEAAETIASLLAGWQGISIQEPLPSWGMDLHQGLKSLMSSKLSPPHRDLTFLLVSTILHVLHHQFLSLSSDHKLSTPRFVALLLHTSCAEIRVVLDEIDSMKQSERERAQGILPLCSQIVESCIKWMCESEGLEMPLVESMREALAGMWDAVGSYLDEIYAKYQGDNDYSHIDNITTASILRLSATFLTEETSIQISKTPHLLALYILVCKQGLTSLPAHPLSFLHPVLASLTSERDVRDTFLASGGPNAVMSFWFQLPTDMSTANLKLGLAGILLNVVATGRVASDNAAKQMWIRFLESLIADCSMVQISNADEEVQGCLIALAVLIAREVQPEPPLLNTLVGIAIQYCIGGEGDIWGLCIMGEVHVSPMLTTQ
ncbi:Neurochondrin-domain-containing protein [Gaertneriomyces semiglobifer]|nr:Neurochondrin-domain-containing protein [Gaertneriomyces semiglobifer]